MTPVIGESVVNTENRAYARDEVNVGVQVIKDNFVNIFIDQQINAKLVDISAKGLRIVIKETDKDKFEKDDNVKVLIPLPESDNDPVINGTITNASTSNGFTHVGVHCNIKNDENDQLLAELVRAALIS